MAITGVCVNKYQWIKQMSVDRMAQLITDEHRKVARQAGAELEQGYEQKVKQDLLSEFKGNEKIKEGTMKTIKVVIPRTETKIKFYIPDYKGTEALVEIGKLVLDNYDEAEVHYIEGEDKE